MKSKDRPRFLSAILLAVVPWGGLPAEDARLVRETEALSPEAQQEKLRVPDGFEIQLFASEPMINKPVNLAFDERGRLWVSSTVEYPYAAERERWGDEQGSFVRDSQDAIKILEDTNGDGKADRVHDFADGLNIPTGVLPWHRPEHKDGCIAWSIPNIWYFADSDGDGVCDHREVLFGPLGYEKDTHGMCSSFRLGPDGWVYGTHGFNNTSHFRVREKNLQGARPGDPGTELELHSGNVYRFRPDGSKIEIWSRGQVNPFGLAFDHYGNLYSADCHSAPVYQLLQGAFYPSFGKPHDGLGFGPAMIEHTHGSTGICGIAIVEQEIWGAEWNDRIFIGNVVTSRINHDRIEWKGSTPVAVEQPDLVVSEDPWFRPVDLCIGPDSALYVADFYNRIIGHYEVPLDHPGRDRMRGRIWRISRRDSEVLPPRKPEPIAINSPLDSLREGSPFETRAAALALQNDPDMDAIPGLLRSLEKTPPEDTHLRHALKLSLREQFLLPGAFTRVSDESGEAPELTTIALAVPTADASEFLFKRIEQDGLRAEEEGLAMITHIGRYGEDTLAAKVVAMLEREVNNETPIEDVAMLAALYEGRLEREGEVLLPEMVTLGSAMARDLLRVEEARGGSAWTNRPHPEFEESKLPWVLQSRSCSDGTEATVLSSLARGEAGAEQRTGILRSRSFAAPEKLGFWICGHRGPPKEPPHQLNRVRLVGEKSDEELFVAFPPRGDVAQLVEWDLSGLEGEKVCLEVVDGDSGSSYAWLGITRIAPGEGSVSIEEFRESGERSAALASLAGMLSRVVPIDLRDRLSPWVAAAPELPEIEVSEEKRAELDRLIQSRIAGFEREQSNPGNGAQLFRAHCGACHQLDGEGGLIGPQLDGVGKRGIDRLAEDILDPNRNVDAHFYLHTLRLKDGSVAGGFVQSESERVIRLVDAAGTVHRISKSEVEEKTLTPYSLMPPNFAEVLSEEEFHDLLAFLSRL